MEQTAKHLKSNDRERPTEDTADVGVIFLYENFLERNLISFWTLIQLIMRYTPFIGKFDYKSPSKVETPDFPARLISLFSRFEAKTQ